MSIKEIKPIFTDAELEMVYDRVIKDIWMIEWEEYGKKHSYTLNKLRLREPVINSTEKA